jgi:gliding motility-associated-like protein
VTGTDNNGCVNSATANVTVNSLPTIIVNSATICPSATATLTAGGAATYTWSTGSTASTITVSPGSNTSYTVAGTDNNGCLNAAVSNITVSGSLVVSALPTNTAVCTGSSTSINASGASTYSWSPAGSLNSSTGASVTANPTVTTTYTITGTSGSCSNTNTVTVTVNSLPTVNGNASSLSVCQGGTVTLNGTGAQTYTWSGGVSDGIPFAPSSTQTYTVTGTDANGCSNIATVSVNINSLPVVTAASATICPSATATLTAGGATTYTWSTGSTTQSLTVAPVSNTSYTVIGTDNNGCVNSAVAIVTISNNLVVSAAPQNASICMGASTAITASGANSYTWSPAGSLSSISGPTVTATPSVTTTYTVDGSSGTCSSTTVVTIMVNNPPNVSANANNVAVCSGGSVTLNGSGALTYTWSGGVINGAPFTPSSTQVYTVTGTDGNGCVNNAVITVTVNPLPDVTANSVSICPGNSATLTAGGAATYTWSTGSQGISVTVSPTVNSTYTVIGTDANGCMNVATGAVSINPLPIVGINSSSPTVCAGGSATLTASGALTYTWSTSQSGNPISVSPVTATSYSVIGTDASGCQNSATIALTVSAPPSPQSINGSPVICKGQATTLSVSQGNYSYSWVGPSGAMGTNASVPASQAGVYTVTITNACGSVSTTFTVSVDAPVASFTANPMQATALASISFTNLSAGSLLSYNWNFANGNTSAVQNPTQVYNNPGSYNVSLVITDSLGCKDSATATILVEDVPVSIVIPNVFSPNADNINDVFFIASSGLSELNCKIYDRWGLLLCEWNGTDGGWDGKNMSNGKQVSDGTYYYILVYKDDRKQESTKTGYLQLVR